MKRTQKYVVLDVLGNSPIPLNPKTYQNARIIQVQYAKNIILYIHAAFSFEEEEKR
jgi:hypothetical protein